MLATFGVGFLSGLIGSIPVAGPIAALVLKKALSGAHQEALAIGVGAAAAESIYAGLAFVGYATLLEGRPWLETVSSVMLAAVLIGLGLTFVRAPSPTVTEEQSARQSSVSRSLLTGFTITVVNPTFLATWTAATSALSASGWLRLEHALAPWFSLGVGAGTSAWFACVSALLRSRGAKLGASRIRTLIQVTGAVLLAFGALALLRLLRSVFDA